MKTVVLFWRMWAWGQLALKEVWRPCPMRLFLQASWRQLTALGMLQDHFGSIWVIFTAVSYYPGKYLNIKMWMSFLLAWIWLPDNCLVWRCLLLGGTKPFIVRLCVLFQGPPKYPCGSFWSSVIPRHSLDEVHVFEDICVEPSSIRHHGSLTGALD